MRLTTIGADMLMGTFPHELDRISTLSATKSNKVSSFESLINTDGPDDSHWIGKRRQPGAAPTVSTASTSPAITPAHEVPWLAPGLYISPGFASTSALVIKRVPRKYPQVANFPSELKSGW